MTRGPQWKHTTSTPATQGFQLEGKPPPTLPAHREQEIRAALEASPSKIVLIVMRGHPDNKPGGVHAGDFENLPDGRKGWDHAAIAFLDKDGNPVYVEKTPGTGAGVVMSANKSGTVRDVTKYQDVEIISLDLTRLPPGARERFITTFMEAVVQPYSLILKNLGNHCSGAFGAALAAAKWPADLVWQKAFQILTMGLRFNTYSPSKAYLDAQKHSVPFRYDPNSPTQGKTIKGDWKYPLPPGPGAAPKKQPVANSADDHSQALAALAGATLLSSQARASQDEHKPLPQELKDPSDEVRASQQPRIDDEHKPLPQELKDLSDDEDVLTDDALQDPEIDADDDDDDLEEEANLASDPQDARTRDAPQQPDIDDDEDDDDDTLIDDADPQAVIDDDDEEDSSQEDDEEDEELVDASDAEDAPTADALQTARAEAGADATADGQPGPQLTASVPVSADDGFSFSLFPKPVPTDVATEALPAEQASPLEESPGSGLPGSESTDPGSDSASVGNAAPVNERVVHHGDLAP